MATLQENTNHDPGRYPHKTQGGLEGYPSKKTPTAFILAGILQGLVYNIR